LFHCLPFIEIYTDFINTASGLNILQRSIISPAGGEADVGERRKLMSDKAKECRPVLDDRCQDRDGEIRRKRSDTLVGTLRETYGPDFAPGIRSDATLGTLLDRSGASSLSEYLRIPKK
jgi:hypothetical protein